MEEEKENPEDQEEVPAHRPQAGFFSGAKRPCTCPPQARSRPSAGASREANVASEAASNG